MKIFPFDHQTEGDVFIGNASIEGKYEFRLALDTSQSLETMIR